MYKQQNLSIFIEDDIMTKLDVAGIVLGCNNVLLMGKSESKIKNIKDLLNAPSVVSGPRHSYFCFEIWFKFPRCIIEHILHWSLCYWDGWGIMYTRVESLV
jgi:hypothetical protein